MSLTPWNVADGGYIKIEFTMPLTGAVGGNESHFTVRWQEYDMVPGGTLITKEVTPLETHAGITEYIVILGMPALQRFINTVGNITVIYDGGGTLSGIGGAIEPFSVSFAPHDLVPKPNQNDLENIEIANVSATGVLTRIYYSSYQEGAEHAVEIAGVSATAVLTYIGDL